MLDKAFGRLFPTLVRTVKTLFLGSIIVGIPLIIISFFITYNPFDNPSELEWLLFLFIYTIVHENINEIWVEL